MTTGGNRIPYSLSAPPTDTLLRITVKVLGDHSNDVAAPAQGHEGVRRRPLRRADPAPTNAAAGPAAGRRHRRHAVAGAVRDPSCASRASSPSSTARPPKSTSSSAASSTPSRPGAAPACMYLVGPPGGDADPFTGRRLAKLVPELTEHDVYLCGPPRMMDAATARASTSRRSSQAHPHRVVRVLGGGVMRRFLRGIRCHRCRARHPAQFQDGSVKRRPRPHSRHLLTHQKAPQCQVTRLPHPLRRASRQRRARRRRRQAQLRTDTHDDTTKAPTKAASTSAKP